jgi:hypothetical protein
MLADKFDVEGVVCQTGNPPLDPGEPVIAWRPKKYG